MQAAIFALAFLCDQCGPGGCAMPMQAPMYVAPAPVVRGQTYWHIWPSNPKQAFLMTDNQCLGGFDLVTEQFRPYSSGQWGEPNRAPVTTPLAKGFWDAQQAQLPTGLDSRVFDQPESYHRKGKVITKKEAFRAVVHANEAAIPDDTNQRHLTIICKDDATAEAAKKRLESKPLADAAKVFRTQVYDTSRKVDSLILESFKLDTDEQFKTAGQVWMVQEPEANGRGKVVFAAYGEQSDEELLDSLRKADPNYTPPNNPKRPDRPKDDPNDDGGLLRKKGRPSLAGFGNTGPYWLCIALAGGVTCFLLARGRRAGRA